MWAQWMVKSQFAKYSKVATQRGVRGYEAAQMLLDRAGITDVKIVRVDGFLSDHYNPMTKSLALSPPVYDSNSVAAIGVATHEAGHAIQHATGYPWLAYRSLIVPAVQFGSPIGNYAMIGGLILMGMGGAMGSMGFYVFLFGVIAFSMLLVFQLITLPVEFNASNRAKALVVEAGIVNQQELAGVAKVLNAAAMTYVAAFVQTLLTLLYFLYRSGLLTGGRR
jgi:Zn-dependent membrane protease YugP